MCASRPVKRSRSEPELDRWAAANTEQKRRRDAALNSSHSAEDVRHEAYDVTEEPGTSSIQQTDARDLLQLALDRICELQRKLMQRGTSCTDGNVLQEFADEQTDESDTEEEETDSSFQDREVVLAGYEFCHKEALRFLVEEEHLGPEHPAVRELSAHLSARRNGIDTAQVLANYMLLTSPSAESINV